MAETEAFIGDEGASFIGEDTLQDLDIPEAHLGCGEPLDRGR
jgi:hypothetical protein